MFLLYKSLKKFNYHFFFVLKLMHLYQLKKSLSGDLGTWPWGVADLKYAGLDWAHYMIKIITFHAMCLCKFLQS